MRSRHLATVGSMFCLLAPMAHAAPVACPAPQSNGQILFADGAVAMRTGLAVNPDGAAASYTPGDHGYTYIANGVNLIEADGTKYACTPKTHQARCRTLWLQAEAMDFGPGSPTFCSYALEVAPFSPGGSIIACESPTRGRYTVGDGKGRPRLGAPTPAFGGGEVRPYRSLTSLRHTVGGQAVAIDSASIPGVVAPREQSSLLGAVVWVRYGGRQAYAIVSDTGPSFGEASVALHRLLRQDAVGALQPVGPIAADRRCSSGELQLKAPFESRPDKPGDHCRPGYVATSPSDIRAYAGIDSGVDSIVLSRVKPAMNDTTVLTALSLAQLEALALKAGYTPKRLAEMAACLK